MIISETIKSKYIGAPTLALVQIWDELIEKQFIRWSFLDEHMRQDLKSATMIQLCEALKGLKDCYCSKAFSYFTVCINASITYHFAKEKTQRQIAAQLAILEGCYGSSMEWN